MIESIPSQGFKIVDLPEDLISLLQVLILDALFPGKSFSFTNEFLISDLPKLLLNINSSSRSLRTVSPDIVLIHSSSILDKLGQVIERPTLLLNNDLYFRVVRPSNIDEISVPHRDIYFHTILPDWRSHLSTPNLKLWIPLMPVTKPSLGVIPKSQLDASFNDVVFKYSDNQPVSFESSIKPSDLSAVPVQYGQGLLFPPSLVHGSIPREQLSSVRISAELTLGYKNLL